MALGGSTNGILHLLALAREAEVRLSFLRSSYRLPYEIRPPASTMPLTSFVFNVQVPLTIEKFNEVAERVPLIGNLTPEGKVSLEHGTLPERQL